MNTLEAAPDHSEDVSRAGSLAARLGAVWRDTDKPWVVLVDAGCDYDGLVGELRRFGIPTFRFADRAMQALDIYRRHREARLAPAQG